jgi:hypothetical protein
LRFLAIFWAVVVSGTGIVAAYLTAQAVKAEVAFWVVVALGALVAAFRWLGPLLLRVAQKVQNYDRMLNRVATMETDLEDAKSSAEILKAEAAKARADGIAEGKSRVFGSMLARKFRPPKVAGITTSEGVVVLIGSVAVGRISVGARYVVRSTNTGQAWGVVEAKTVNASGDSVILRCVEPVLPRFWDALASRVLEDDSPPRDVELEPYVMDFDPNPPMSGPLTIEAADSEQLETPNG